MLKFLLIRWAIASVAVGLTAALLSGIHIEGGIAVVFGIALVLGAVNAIVGSLLKLFTLPLIVLTLGLFALVINAGMLLLTDAMLDRLEVDGFWWALGGSILISIVIVVGEVLVSSRTADDVELDPLA